MRVDARCDSCEYRVLFRGPRFEVFSQTRQKHEVRACAQGRPRREDIDETVQVLLRDRSGDGENDRLIGVPQERCDEFSRAVFANRLLVRRCHARRETVDASRVGTGILHELSFGFVSRGRYDGVRGGDRLFLLRDAPAQHSPLFRYVDADGVTLVQTEGMRGEDERDVEAIPDGACRQCRVGKVSVKNVRSDVHLANEIEERIREAIEFSSQVFL